MAVEFEPRGTDQTKTVTKSENEDAVPLTLAGEDILRRSGLTPELKRSAEFQIANHAEKISTPLTSAGEVAEAIQVKTGRLIREQSLWQSTKHYFEQMVGRQYSMFTRSEKKAVTAEYMRTRKALENPKGPVVTKSIEKPPKITYSLPPMRY